MLLLQNVKEKKGQRNKIQSMLKLVAEEVCLRCSEIPICISLQLVRTQSLQVKYTSDQ